MVSLAESMQEQLTAQKTDMGNKENLRRTVDVLAVATSNHTYYYYLIWKRFTRDVREGGSSDA